MTETAPILQLHDVRKYFGGVKAVDGMSLSVDEGEVHAIVGSNGAGKSTLMNILAGVYPADSGEIVLSGDPYAPSGPRAARGCGISIVFQELALFPSLAVDANLFIGKEEVEGMRLQHRTMREEAQEALRRMGVELDATEQVGGLSIGHCQWVEIARALTDNARVLILDEPNSALNQYETAALFDLIRRLKVEGMTIIYISHRIEEVFQIADRITVMRDGKNVGTWETEKTSVSEVVMAMVGREVDALLRRTAAVQDVTVLEGRDLSLDGRLEGISLSVRAGEVVGVSGLAGSGITELFEVLFGVRRPTSGHILLHGKPVQVSTPVKAVQNHVGMVPADRRGLGLMMNWEVLSNITIGVLSRLSRLGFLNRNRSAELAQEYVDRLGIVTENLDKGVLYLSGGNQQKVLLARWLATKPRVLILDDPTRGIDVGAKREIYALIGRIAAEGVAVLITSSEMDEVRALSDRVLVMRNGRLIADLPQQACSKRVLMELVAGDPEKVRAMVEGCPDAVLSLSPRPATETAYENERVDGNKRKLRPSGGVKLNGGLGARAGRLVAAREFSVFLALCVVGLVFSVLTPHFLKASNLLLVSRQMVLLGIMTAGMTFVLGSGEVDLSVGWIFNMVMSSMAYLMANYGVNAWVTLPVGLMISVLLGTVNGVIAVSMRLPTIIVTLGTMTLFRGMSLALNGGRTIANLPDSSFFLIGTESIGPMPVMTIIMIVVVAACAWLLRNTRIARHLLAMGSNSVAAARLGIQTNRLRVLVMAFNGLMCGIAGAIGLAFLGAADAQSGTGYDLSAIAAAIVGGAELGGGSGTVWGSLIGIGLIMVIQNGLVLLGLRPAWQIASTGLVIIAAVTIDHFIQERRARLREASRM